ncbi:methylated-DNA--[protein]-cysteine S-methyltransferase [Herbiconiux sp. L3-i23]|uniref:methylated-DNA--[protein]-cysteine S-methyltransferase n=1 Tax=Herbiconiux sp. L3-i23 TaxID=2905871 RepID=UPI00205224FD|nr:methylated-DNA--[protein]-cysteine S-methyltransferase [Herbiconiux sp. L3-i23]BDI23791.1 putative methylated-DNA:protein-cysteine methyltransferase [Herbiconiux sp. L3-i23]
MTTQTTQTTSEVVENAVAKSAVVEIIDTPDGPFGIIEGERGVLASGWTSDVDALLARIPVALRPDDVATGTTRAAAAALAYYDGDLAAIDTVPVEQLGGVFRTAAWQALRRIAPGAPLTYTAFAELTGSPRAVRAAASACATNAPALFVPCHRVLRTDGSMGGFAWGVDVKRSLLVREERRTA